MKRARRRGHHLYQLDVQSAGLRERHPDPEGIVRLAAIEVAGQFRLRAANEGSDAQQSMEPGAGLLEVAHHVGVLDYFKSWQHR